MASFQVIFEDNHLLIINKPINMPSQEDDSKDLDVLTAAKAYLKEKYDKPGNVYLGLVHRLDRPVGGLMVLAKTSKAAARLSKQIQEHAIIKEYNCVVEGKAKIGEYVDYLLKDRKTNTTIVHPKGKKATLVVLHTKQYHDLCLCHLRLESGRSHQIRVQMASRNTPIINDHRYNKNAKVNHDIALFATKLSFEHPTSKEPLSFTLDVPNTYPWNQFQ
jgi:23S rRNA pseudouridine1911/1915/1917 synthase